VGRGVIGSSGPKAGGVSLAERDSFQELRRAYETDQRHLKKESLRPLVELKRPVIFLRSAAAGKEDLARRVAMEDRVEAD
jgi:hypothetical protein